MMQVVNAGAPEDVYEYTPEPAPAPLGSRDGLTPKVAQGASPLSIGGDGIDQHSAPARDAFGAFAKREADSGAAASSSSSSRPRTEFEALGGTPGMRGFEPPEQRLARLQAEVADLLRLAESPAAQGSSGEVAELLGSDPAVVTDELKVLEQRLGSLAREGPPMWRSLPGANEAVSGPMPQSLTARLERLSASGLPPMYFAGGGDGRVSYEINYTPSAATLADSSKIAALESNIAEIEKRLGALDPASPITDLQTAITQMQKRLSLLDTNKIDAISRRVHVVMTDVDHMLIKKGELLGAHGADHDLDQKVVELYDFCHRWSSTAQSLPAIVSRLQSLQALHQQSASFVSRLAALEQQQDELARLLETTNAAVQELGSGLQENMTIIRDNMRELEAKISKAVRK